MKSTKWTLSFLSLFTVSITGYTQVNVWTGAGSGNDWTTGANWSQGTELDGSDTGGGWLGAAGGGVSTIDAPYSRNQLYTIIVNEGHTVTQNGGYVQTRQTPGSHVYIGDASGPGTWVVNGGNLETENNSIRLGRFDGSEGTLILNSGGGINVRGSLFLGGGGGNFGTSTGTTGTSGNGTFIMTGGTFDNSGNSAVGVTAGATGTILQSSGTANWNTLGSSYLNLGQSGTGTYLFTGGTLNLNRELRIGAASGGAGTFRMEDGATLNGSQFIYTGYGNGATAIFELAGGLIDTTQGFRVGENGDGTVNQTGGTLQITGSAGLPMGVGANGDAVYNLSAGAIQHSGASSIQVGMSGRGTLNVSNSAILNSGATLWIANGAGEGTIRQTGGEIAAPK